MPENLEILDLYAGIEDKIILKGVNISIRKGELHVLMGPNASGKSTLAHVIMGNPKYRVDKGDIRINGESILSLSTNERAAKGIFLGFQYPLDIDGVNYFKFLWNAYSKLYRLRNRNGEPDIMDFKKKFDALINMLRFDSSIGERYLNVGFSGGERKRAEILQLLALDPKYIVLDEPDTGLDIDSLKIVADAINTVRSPDRAILLITHYQRILDYIMPDNVHVMIDGKIVVSGGFELAKEIERKGYEWILEKVGGG
jgi:Fe-S cluster assembly ATP-binding protein